MQHYAACRFLHTFAQVSLRLPEPGDAGRRRQAFVLLEAAGDLDEHQLCLPSLFVGAAYRSHCVHRRHGGLEGEEVVRRALGQGVKEAALEHRFATRSLDCRWVRHP